MILVSLNKLSAFLSTFVLCLWFVSVSNDDAHNICDHEDHLGTVGGNYHDIFCSRWSQLCIQYNIFAVVISQSAAENVCVLCFVKSLQCFKLRYCIVDIEYLDNIVYISFI